MISQAHRFHGRNALRFAYQRGQTVRGPAIGLRFVLNPRRKGYRLAVVVSRKVSKSAVVRNRIRRRLYEMVRKQAHLINGPYDLIFSIYGEDLAAQPHDLLEQTVVMLLKKACTTKPLPTTPEHAIVVPKETNE